MPPKPTSFRLPAITLDQLRTLANQWGTTITQALIIAIERAHRPEKPSTKDEPTP